MSNTDHNVIVSESAATAVCDEPEATATGVAPVGPVGAVADARVPAQPVADIRVPAQPAVDMRVPAFIQRCVPALRLSTFIHAAGNRLAANAATLVANAPGVQYNPLYLHSDTGLGKTHLLQGIVNHISETRPDLVVGYTTAADLVATIRRHIEDRTIELFHVELSAYHVIAVDDAHLLAQDPEACQEFQRLFDTRFNHGCQFVFAANGAPQRIDNLPQGMVSRFLWSLVVEIGSLTPATKAEMVKTLAARLNLDLPPEAVDFLAGRDFANLREINGILQKIRVAREFMGTEINLEFLQTLAPQPTVPPTTETYRSVSIADVDVFVRDRFRLTHEDMHSKSRSRAVVLPRQIAMYICHTYTRASMEAIGIHFGGRDHSTVKHACEKISAIIGRDPSIQRIVEDFLKQSQQQTAAGR